MSSTVICPLVSLICPPSLALVVFLGGRSASVSAALQGERRAQPPKFEADTEKVQIPMPPLQNLKRARNQRHLNLPAILGQELRLGVLNIGLRRAAPDSIVPDRTQARRSTSSPRARP